MLINVSEKVTRYKYVLLRAFSFGIANAVIIRDVNRAVIQHSFAGPESADKICAHVRKHLATHVRSLLLLF